MADAGASSAIHPPAVRGYLVIVVEEASGKTSQQGRDFFTWDTNSSSGIPFEAFVRVEIRGGARNVKAQTVKKALVGETITWQEELRLELLEGSNELRLMLCREKFQGTKRGTSVIAACGIYVNDIIDACPIDKYFELFKPNMGGEGGIIRVNISFVKDLAELRKAKPGPSGATAEPARSRGSSSAAEAALVPASSTGSQRQQKQQVTDASEAQSSKPKKSRKRFLLPIVFLVAVLGGATTFILADERRKKQEGGGGSKAEESNK